MAERAHLKAAKAAGRTRHVGTEESSRERWRKNENNQRNNPEHRAQWVLHSFMRKRICGITGEIKIRSVITRLRSIIPNNSDSGWKKRTILIEDYRCDSVSLSAASGRRA